MKRFWIGSVVAWGALAGAYVLEGGDLLALVQFSGLLITVLVPWGTTVAVWSFRDLVDAWRAASRGTDSSGAARAAALWSFVEVACYLAGGLAALAGSVLVLSNVGHADQAQIGHAFAALLVSPLYGLWFGLGARTLRARVNERARSLHEVEV